MILRNYLVDICGLDSEDIQNPFSILRELTQAKSSDKSVTNELLELSNPSVELERETKRTEIDHGQTKLLPSLIESATTKVNSTNSHREPFKCNCPILSIDQQRNLFLIKQVVFEEEKIVIGSSENENRKKLSSSLRRHKQTSSSGINTVYLEPLAIEQEEEFGQTNRNSVVKKTELAKRLRLYGKDLNSTNERIQDELSLALYTMERVLREANSNLVDNLKLEASRSSLFLEGIWDRYKLLLPASKFHLEEEEEEHFESKKKEHGVVMIRAPVLPACVSSSRRRRKTPSAGSRWTYACSRDDSGVETEEEELLWLSNEQQNGYFNKILRQRAKFDRVQSGSGVALEEFVKFRSDLRVQKIVRQSVELFQELISESPLFKLINNSKSSSEGTNKLFTSQELKLFACIECQQLRSSIRFKWITQCLIVAFEQVSTQLSRAKGAAVITSKNKLAPLISSEVNGPKFLVECSKEKHQKEEDEEGETNRLPPIERHKLEDLQQFRYFDLLAHLMGQLLRQHFLVPALEQWHRLLEKHQFVCAPTTTTSGEDENLAMMKISDGGGEPKLGIQLELLEELMVETTKGENALDNGRAPPTLLACSRPEDEFKETVGFVVDEIASVCRHLPRLESQLESTKGSILDEVGREKKEEEFILNLEANDNLLVTSKRRLNQLIDHSTSVCRAKTNNNNKLITCDSSDVLAPDRSAHNAHSQKQKQKGWVDSDYLRIVELVNNFRCGLLNTQALKAIVVEEDATNEFNQSEEETKMDKEDDRSTKIRLCSKQIRLLDSLEKQLTCKLDRYHDYGFVLLDYGPLRDSLIKCIQKERLLLIRLHLDELLKLMDRTRLQFEEIELGVDLETAIDDYLNERRQVKQSQHQQVMLGADGEIEFINENGDMDDNGDGDEPSFIRENLMKVEATEKEVKSNEQVTKEDEFVEAISQPLNANENHKLLALSAVEIVEQQNATDSSDQSIIRSLLDDGRGQQMVIPLIECKLLVDRYEYMSDLLANELKLLASDVKVSFEGLIFLSNFVQREQLDPTHWELITELADRSREFQPMLNNSMLRLNRARQRLCQLNELRSQVLSRLALEFHLLMGELTNRLLERELYHNNGDAYNQKPAIVDNISGRRNDIRRILQLDAIQETADWARELEMRFSFLESENILLADEGNLLSKAKLTKLLPESTNIEEEEEINNNNKNKELEEAHRARASILDRWRPLVSALSNLWRLIEEYETQQVRWLNSDTKRIDFNQMDATYRKFCQRFEELKNYYLDMVKDTNSQQLDNLKPNLDVFKLNLEEFKMRLDQFAKRRLPLFKFLTNKYLTDAHWTRVEELLRGDTNHAESPSAHIHNHNLGGLNRMFAGNTIAPQACTTLAQFLELNADRYVDQLDAINREAVIEQELTNFLLAEASSDISYGSNKRAQLKALDLSGAWFEGWTDEQLVVAASRFIEVKLKQQEGDTLSQVFSSNECRLMAQRLVSSHSLVRRHLKLRYETNLDSTFSMKSKPNSKMKVDEPKSSKKMTLRTCKLLTSPALVTPSLFVEFLRLFTLNWISERAKLARVWQQLTEDSDIMDKHLADIQSLIDRVKELRENDLKVATSESEATLVELERETVKLEIEREILATKESLALERQREALERRDECIRQITERAIPAIRAATRALDCLDARSLRTLRYVKPNPPNSVRLVLEAVCLLRSCSITTNSSTMQPKPMEPERRFNSLEGRIHEDYWPPTCRMLNGTHSSQIIKDLRKVDKRTIPKQVMRLIRRRYLSSSKFNPRLIERVSPECALLARWLIAVDIFDRVINVVRPNYNQYLESERQLASLLMEVNNRRRQIDLIGQKLQQMEESFERRMSLKMSLVDSLSQCKGQLQLVEVTRMELIVRRQACLSQLERVERHKSRLANKCLMRAAKTVYLDAMRSDECKPMTVLLRSLFQC